MYSVRSTKSSGLRPQTFFRGRQKVIKCFVVLHTMNFWCNLCLSTRSDYFCCRIDVTQTWVSVSDSSSNPSCLRWRGNLGLTETLEEISATLSSPDSAPATRGSGRGAQAAGLCSLDICLHVLIFCDSSESGRSGDGAETAQKKPKVTVLIMKKYIFFS